MSAPENFDLATAAEDFNGPHRHVEVIESRTGSLDYCRLQMKVTVNGWTFSAVWGTGTYCSGARGHGPILAATPKQSPDAEVAVWKGDGPMIELHGDTVEGWVSPASFLEAVEAAERDDEAGIRAALVRGET